MTATEFVFKLAVIGHEADGSFIIGNPHPAATSIEFVPSPGSDALAERLIYTLNHSNMMNFDVGDITLEKVVTGIRRQLVASGRITVE